MYWKLYCIDCGEIQGCGIGSAFNVTPADPGGKMQKKKTEKCMEIVFKNVIFLKFNYLKPMGRNLARKSKVVVMDELV